MTFGDAEIQACAVPIRPGEPGKAPFWNLYSRRFIFAPAFNFPRVPDARVYRYDIVSLKDSSTYRFESHVPHAPLTPVWTSVPVGRFQLKVLGIAESGQIMGMAGGGEYFRAAPFNGPYHEPVIPYERSGMLALETALNKDYVEYWLVNQAPDPSYQYYRYAAKIFGSIVVGAVAHAQLKPNTDDALRSKKLAVIVADYLLGLSFPQGHYLEHFPPTYHGERIGRSPRSHMQLNNYMTIVAADSGHAYLDLYELTGDTKYLDAAKRIAQTYLKTQLPSGSWHLYVNHETGEPTAPHVAIPTSTISYFDRLRKSYGVTGLEEATRRAFNWVMDNPAKTFHWQSQYEDVDIKAYFPYEKLSREQPCDLAIYLFQNFPDRPDYVALAKDLIRFSEDQFVTWEQPEDLVVVPGPPVGREGRQTVRPAIERDDVDPSWYSRNWMTPTVHEQYGFWMPSGRNTGLMIQTYWHAYTATKEEVYLAKAKSIANNFTRLQAEHDGDYPTMFTKYPTNYWINNCIYPAKVMIEFERQLETVS
jgi:hypothetical protein